MIYQRSNSRIENVTLSSNIGLNTGAWLYFLAEDVSLEASWTWRREFSLRQMIIQRDHQRSANTAQKGELWEEKIMQQQQQQ